MIIMVKIKINYFMCHKSKVRMLNKKVKHLILFTELYREMIKKN